MKQRWKDWFTDQCETCEVELTKEGMVYIINKKIGICADCYESVMINLLDVDIDEIHESDCDCLDCIDELVAGVAAMGPEDME